MGKPSTTSPDAATTLMTGSFAATGQSATVLLKGYFNMVLWGVFVGTVKLEASFDGGTTWITASFDTAGDPVSFTAPNKVIGFEPESGVLYRFNCTAYTSGTINYRLSESGYGGQLGLPLNTN